MIVLHWTKRFEKRVKTLGPEERSRTAKSLKQFLANYRHPSLNFEKLSTGYYTIRVDLNFRIAMRKNADGSYDLLDVDTHSSLYNRYG